MKVGILTLPMGHNYGGIIQNWALQQVLISLGHEPKTYLIRERSFSWTKYIWNVILVARRRLLGTRYEWPLGPMHRLGREFQGLEKFVYNNITHTRLYTFVELDKCLSRLNSGAFIVGSDQVWRPMHVKDISRMFLPTINGEKVRKISYGASFGTDKWEYSHEETTICQKLLDDFKAVSVREQSGNTLCRTNLNCKDVTTVLDPTLLVYREKYDKLCNDIPRVEKSFIFAYILDFDDKKIDYAKRVAGKFNLELRVCSADSSITSEDTVEKWLANFRDASYVITDSFHGTVFSIIYCKPFSTFYNEGRGNARMDNLIEILGIGDRIINSDYKKLSEQMDWESIYAKLDKERTKSIDFLRLALS